MFSCGNMVSLQRYHTCTCGVRFLVCLVLASRYAPIIRRRCKLRERFFFASLVSALRYGLVKTHLSERILRVNFAPHCDRRVPHLRVVSCGLAFLFGTKFPPQSATRGSAFLVYRRPPISGRGEPERKDRKDRKNRNSCPSYPSCSPLFTGIFFNTCTAGAP